MVAVQQTVADSDKRFDKLQVMLMMPTDRDECTSFNAVTKLEEATRSASVHGESR